ARRLDETGEAERGQPVPHLARSLDDPRPAQSLVRIEVEDQTVRSLRIVGTGAPRMDLENADLHEGQEPGEVINGQIVRRGAGFQLRDPHPADRGRYARTGVPLEEAWLAL